MSSFEPNPFCTTAGVGMFSALATVASAARNHAQAAANADATDAAIAMWESEFERQQAENAALLSLVEVLKATVLTQARTIGQLRNEIAETEAMVADFLDQR
jgi:hypothetical protein